MLQHLQFVSNCACAHLLTLNCWGFATSVNRRFSHHVTSSNVRTAERPQTLRCYPHGSGPIISHQTFVLNLKSFELTFDDPTEAKWLIPNLARKEQTLTNTILRRKTSNTFGGLAVPN
ncbi:MAG: hypothetical protein ACTS5R_00540 [Candidatus Hodgkinia cicadicola]